MDLLELRSYTEIDLDETPIVVIDCGHFFTAESLDGMVFMNTVYQDDGTGTYTDFLQPPEAVAVPCCPDCKRQIKQFATRRFNRVVNMAVMDETAKKFLIKGQADLAQLEERAAAAEAVLGKTQAAAKTEWTKPPGGPSAGGAAGSKKSPAVSIEGRYTECKRLETLATRFCHDASAEQQPSKKLVDAILTAKDRLPLDARLASLSLTNAHAMVPAADSRIILGGQQVLLRIQTAMLHDQLELLDKLPNTGPWTAHIHPDKLAGTVLGTCQKLMKESVEKELFRQAAQAMVAYARIIAAIRASRNARTKEVDMMAQWVETARALLDEAEKYCGLQFEDADSLRAEVEGARRLLGKEWYEAVTPEELAAIKKAMVSGPRGIATHSGHWYRCENGHVFAIGECGMAMELGRCPECGARIGGQNHTLETGVLRATEMEN